MLKITNLNKYFNKGKKNELHVINNTSITLEDNGLVALLGPSGCGKTTLLNCIGGLDKVKSGSIYIDNERISSKLTSKVDRIRNLSIGYIFQDYKLIDNMTVYDNVALVLTMIGIKDKNEIKTRVEYVLDKVGMLRYKRRPAGMLSGGERQRVGIARAIVKDPNIILADEPTGNLDSKNSLEIMKIIKAISKDRLVILVTHEQSLAKFYASRIIEIQDGKIIEDYKNELQDSLDYEIDNTFYLKDLKLSELSKDKNEINIYTDLNSNDKIKLDIVIKKGNIYIRSNTKDKIEVIDESSSIEMIDEHYKQIDKSDIEKYEFNFKQIINNKFKKRYSSIFNPISLIIKGFKKVFDLSILKKILLIGFAISGMFIMYALSSIGGALTVKDSYFVEKNKEYINVFLNDVKVRDYLNIEKMDNIDYILPGDSLVNFIIKYNYFYQTNNALENLKGSLSNIDLINKDDLIIGRMPNNRDEIVVDKLAITNMFLSKTAKMAGVLSYKDLLNKTVSIDNMKEFTIVGFTDLNSPSIYTDKNNFINIISNSKENVDDLGSGVYDYNLFNEIVTLKEGRYPTNDYETIVNINEKNIKPLNKEVDVKINDKKLVVVGYYTSPYAEFNYLVNNNTVKYLTITKKSKITVYSKNKKEAINELRKENFNAEETYITSKNSYLDAMNDTINSILLISGIMLAISLIEVFFMIRSSFLSRIKEIGIYRAIGVKKLDIYKMFFGEIFAMTTLSSIPGLLFMAYILNIVRKISIFSRMFLINPLIIIIAIILVYLFNLIIGLLPVFNTIRKRPAEILSRHDLD